ncbi:MAG: DUF1996 domain-containing protein [Roseiflexaceae bacterium]
MNKRFSTILVAGGLLIAGVAGAIGFTQQAAANQPTVAATNNAEGVRRGPGGNGGNGGNRGGNGARGASFRVECATGQVAAVDPIVMPGHAGMSHFHQFFGNLALDENSTAASLRAEPATSCRNRSDSSGYWVPTLINDGTMVSPTGVDIIYRKSVNAPIVAHPAGLMLIAGSSKATEAQAASIVSWSCTGSNAPGTAAPTVCRARQRLVATVRFPECWDGTNLDSADHKSHVSYASNGVCAAGTVALPQIEMRISYPRQATVSTLSLASGSIYSMHADFFNGWDQGRFERQVARLN